MSSVLKECPRECGKEEGRRWFCGVVIGASLVWFTHLLTNHPTHLTPAEPRENSYILIMWWREKYSRAHVSVNYVLPSFHNYLQIVLIFRSPVFSTFLRFISVYFIHFLGEEDFLVVTCDLCLRDNNDSSKLTSRLQEGTGQILHHGE